MNLFKKLSLGSKILLMLLLTALLSILLTGYISYSGGRNGLTEAVFNQLTSLRNAQAQAITNDFQRSENFVLTLSEAQMIINATKEFKAAFAKLKDASITPEQKQKLANYYQTEFIPRLKKNLPDAGEPVAQSYIPSKPAEQYLQYYYLAANPNPTGQKIKLDFAGDGSEYSSVHREFHPKFRNILDRMGYYDAFLIDADTGQVVYTSGKEGDFVTDLENGPYAASNLAKAFRKSFESKDAFFVSLVDFENHRGSFGKPSAFITTTVFEGDKLIGVLILQLSNERLNGVMTYDRKWDEAGLGRTGETYLVGEDELLRTETRLFAEDKEAYFKVLEAANFDPEQIERIRNVDSPVLAQKVDNDGVRRALAGETGESFYKDYRGRTVLSAFQPVKIGDFRWALIAEMDEEEAFKAVHDLTRRLIVATAILIPLFTLLSLYASRLLVRPINRLIAATKKITAGERDVRVAVGSRDEVGQLAETFNLMSSKLDEKDRLIDRQISENNRLLLNILPETVAKRVQGGEQDIADSFPNVTIIYAEIEGFNDFSGDTPTDRTVALLNDLIGAIDETAELYGVEKLKTVGSAYIAVCGLTIPRVDHAKRAMDFAFAILKLIRVFNQKHGSNLGMDIGIHSGPVVAGIVGKTKFIYELWGETMNICKKIHESPDTNIIQVTEPVYSSLQGLYEFTPLEEVMIKGRGKIPVWSVQPLAATSIVDNGGQS